MFTCWAVKGWKSLAMWFLFVFVHQITVPGTLPATATGPEHHPACLPPFPRLQTRSHSCDLKDRTEKDRCEVQHPWKMSLFSLQTYLASVKNGSAVPLAGLICIFKHISKAAADFSEGKAKRLLVILSGISQKEVCPRPHWERTENTLDWSPSPSQDTDNKQRGNVLIQPSCSNVRHGWFASWGDLLIFAQQSKNSFDLICQDSWWNLSTARHNFISACRGV